MYGQTLANTGAASGAVVFGAAVGPMWVVLATLTIGLVLVAGARMIPRKEH